MTKKLLLVAEDISSRRRLFSDLVTALCPDYRCDVIYAGHKFQNPLAFSDKYAAIVASPPCCIQLHSVYGFPYNRMIAFAQHVLDIFPAMQYMHEQLLGYAVNSELLRHISFACGLRRIPAILPVGLYCENYEKPTGEQFQRLIWLDEYPPEKSSSVDISRIELGRAVAERASCELVTDTNFCFLTTEALYKPGDLGIFCSLVGTPYAALEAFAAGVPVLGTETGIFTTLAQSGGGGLLPFAEDELVENAVEVICAVRDNPALYRRMSEAAAHESKTRDWSVARQTWLEFLQQVP